MKTNSRHLLVGPASGACSLIDAGTFGQEYQDPAFVERSDGIAQAIGWCACRGLD